MSTHITYPQRLIMDVIRDYLTVRGEGPTVRDIGALVGLSSTSSVAYHLRQLETKGMLHRTGHGWRSVQIGPAPSR